MRNFKAGYLRWLRFKRPTFLIGFASVLDLGGALFLYRLPQSPFEADAKAMANDWVMVGSDIRNATEKFERETNQNR